MVNRDKGLISRLTLPQGEVWSEDYCKDGVYILDWKRAARFRISVDGRYVRRRVHPGAAPISVEILRHLAQAYANSLRGRESLHATTLKKEGRAIALVGPSGEGKSTLAAYLLKSDPSTRLLCDDLLYVEVIRDQARAAASRGTSRLKLSKRTLLHFGFNGRHGIATQFDPNLEKEIIRFPSKNSRPVPLAGIVQLYRGGYKTKLKIKRIKGARAALILLAFVYNEIIRPPRVLKNQFDLCTRVSRVVPLWRLTFPSGFKSLPAVASRLDRIWSG